MTKILNKESLVGIAPKLAEITNTVLFDDIWQREELSSRERSLITLGALTALGRHDQLEWHINYAIQNGLNLDELIEIFTHLAFYTGWPSAICALERLPEKDASCH